MPVVSIGVRWSNDDGHHRPVILRNLDRSGFALDLLGSRSLGTIIPGSVFEKSALVIWTRFAAAWSIHNPESRFPSLLTGYTGRSVPLTSVLLYR